MAFDQTKYKFRYKCKCNLFSPGAMKGRNLGWGVNKMQIQRWLLFKLIENVKINVNINVNVIFLTRSNEGEKSRLGG